MKIRTPEEELETFLHGAAQNLAHPLDAERWHRYVVARHLTAGERSDEDDLDLDRELRKRLAAAHCDHRTIDSLMDRLHGGLLILAIREADRYNRS